MAEADDICDVIFQGWNGQYSLRWTASFRAKMGDMFHTYWSDRYQSSETEMDNVPCDGISKSGCRRYLWRQLSRTKWATSFKERTMSFLVCLSILKWTNIFSFFVTEYPSAQVDYTCDGSFQRQNLSRHLSTKKWATCFKDWTMSFFYLSINVEMGNIPCDGISPTGSGPYLWRHHSQKDRMDDIFVFLLRAAVKIKITELR